MRSSEVLEPLNGLGETEVRQHHSGGKKDDRGRHEGHGVALLARLESRGDKTPSLPEDHRRRDHESGEEGNLHAKIESVEWVRYQEFAVSRTRRAVGILQYY